MLSFLLCSRSCASVFALHAGCLVAAFRMALWAALILVDREWLTDDDVTINGESWNSSTALWLQAPMPLVSQCKELSSVSVVS